MLSLLPLILDTGSAIAGAFARAIDWSDLAGEVVDIVVDIVIG